MSVYSECRDRFHRWLCRRGHHDWVNVEVKSLEGWRKSLEGWRQYAYCARCGKRFEGRVS